METTTTIRVTPLSGVLGAEISGIDLHKELGTATVEQLRRAWLEYHLLFVREQDLTDIEHMRFCQYLGDIQVERTAPQVESKEIAGMLFVSNVREDAILPTGDMWFHSDQCYFDTPCKATSLYALETPSSGGHTRFANCHLAYESLPDSLQRQIDGRVAMNKYDYPSPNSYKKVAERVPDAPQYPHPIVRTHPETGRKSLYVNRLMTDYILDMGATESRELLGILFDNIENEDFVYEHTWRPKDLIIWDEPLSGSCPHQLRRVTKTSAAAFCASG